MPEQLEPGPDHLKELGYEHRDVILPTLVKWIAGLFVFLGICSGLALVLYIQFVPYHPERIEVKPAEAHPEDRVPNPRVQADPIKDMVKFRADEEALLRGYAWTDKAKGRVRIPVAIAIEKMATQPR